MCGKKTESSVPSHFALASSNGCRAPLLCVDAILCLAFELFLLEPLFCGEKQLFFPPSLTRVTATTELSESAAAIHHAARTLRTIFTERWSTLAYQLKVGTMVFMIQFLGAKGLMIPPFAAMEVSLLIARIAKLGWHEGEEMKSVIARCNEFMSMTSLVFLFLFHAWALTCDDLHPASPTHAPLGLKLLAHVVTDMVSCFFVLRWV